MTESQWQMAFNQAENMEELRGAAVDKVGAEGGYEPFGFVEYDVAV
jgi:hypothetical protein